MNEILELRESRLVAVTCVEGPAILSLRPAYIHGTEASPGSGWLQPVSLIIDEASREVVPQLPASIRNGSVRIGDELYESAVPAEGSFEGPIEIRLLLDTSESYTVRGSRLTITRHGEPTYVE